MGGQEEGGALCLLPCQRDHRNWVPRNELGDLQPAQGLGESPAGARTSCSRLEASLSLMGEVPFPFLVIPGISTGGHPDTPPLPDTTGQTPWELALGCPWLDLRGLDDTLGSTNMTSVPICAWRWISGCQGRALWQGWAAPALVQAPGRLSVDSLSSRKCSLGGIHTNGEKRLTLSLAVK